MNYSKRLVPWQKWEEWRYVKELLYSDNYEYQQEGISIVKAWKCRCSSIPVAVESTSLFSELLIKMDEMIRSQTIESNQIQYSELVNASSMAIIRMVNGLIDVEQKGAYSKSVNVIAEEIGLPREFVDLRHRCTHGTIPSFEVLYSALQEGKQWLYEVYWLKQEAAVSDHINSIIQQLIAVSQLACSNCDPNTFNRKGEVYNILRLLFQNTSQNDLVDTVIPVLTGTSRYSYLNFWPVVLPDFAKDTVDQNRWLQNWNKIIIIAASYWSHFIDSFIEHAAMYIVVEDASSKANEWMRCLIHSLFTKRFYTMRFQQKVKLEGLCSLAEIQELNYFPDRYVHILLQSTNSIILDFIEEVFNEYIVEEDKQLLSIRREMGGIQKEPLGNIPIQNERLQEIEKALKEMERNRSSILRNSTPIRYEYDDVPIGSILFYFVCYQTLVH